MKSINEEQQDKLISTLAKSFSGYITPDTLTNQRKRAFATIINYQIADSKSGELVKVADLLTQEQVGNVLDGIQQIHIHKAVGQIKVEMTEVTE